MVSAKLKIGLPILIGTLGAYYNVPENYVESSSGEYISNKKLFELLTTSESLKGLRKWYEERIGQVVDKPSGTIRLTTSIWNTASPSLTKEIGEERIKALEDYTIRISSDCSSGTGWFLDYEIPENNKYPIKWFIATNAHVISNIKFRNNPYNQYLPVNNSWFNFGEYCPGSYMNPYTNVYLTREVGENYKILNPERDHDVFGLRQLNRFQDESVIQLKLENPKLFYAPINFLGTRWEESRSLLRTRKNYFKDFAVLEVNFPSEEKAKQITNNFFTKQKEEKIKTLDFLNFSLLNKDKSGKDLMENKDWYFTAGYPGNSGQPLSIFSNYSSSKKTASVLSKKYSLQFTPQNKHKEYLFGLADIGKIDEVDTNDEHANINWGGTKIKGWGYNYVIDNVKLGPGSSGSLVTNSKGEVLGLLSRGDKKEAHENGSALIEPLRSDGLVLDGKIVFPKYDLIQGTEGQLGSYKEQLDTYFPNLKTYLRNKWNNPSKST